MRLANSLANYTECIWLGVDLAVIVQYSVCLHGQGAQQCSCAKRQVGRSTQLQV